MRKINGCILGAFIAFLFQGCIFSAYDKKLNKGYYLEAVDVNEEMSLCFKDNTGVGLTLIPETVFAVGQDDNFIIVKQHPRRNKKITSYYVIPLTNKISDEVEHNKIGPLTYKEFEQRMAAYGFEGLRFTIEFRDLE